MENKRYTSEQHQNNLRYLDLKKEEFEKKLQNRCLIEKCPEDYERIQAIGNGAFGKVYLVRDKATFTYYAMKVVEKSIVVERKHVQHIIMERKILQSVEHPFLISTGAAFKDNVYLYLVLPFINGGDLFTFIQKYGRLSENLGSFHAAQIVLALEYLHHCCVIHRDLKPENVVINWNGYLVLCDFGLCKLIKNRTWSLCGTPEYLAPEMVLSTGYGFAVDWWALGILIFEMCSGYPPFMSSNPNKLYDKILDGHYKFPEALSRDLKLLLRGFLQSDPTKRLGSLITGTYDIKSQAWFRDTDWDSLLQQKVIAPFTPVCTSPGDTSNFPDIEHHVLKTASNCLYEDEFLDF